MSNSPKHQFIQYTTDTEETALVREIALAMMNHYFSPKQPLSRSKWLEKKLVILNWYTEKPDDQQRIIRHEFSSKPISLTQIEWNLMSKNLHFTKQYMLPEFQCSWLDPSVSLGPGFHAVSTDGKESLVFQIPTTLGSTFPLIPRIDREGFAYNSLQTLIQNRINRLREELIEKSADYANEAWLQDLRSFICECIALIDITLHQLYFKAQYSPLKGWTFDPVKLGDRHGRRMEDKLNWVYQITKNHINAGKQISTVFYNIKDLRNHLQHFDPPCFCFTLEDVVGWLNASRFIARLAWKIRAAVGSPLSMQLVQMLLAPPVQFIPSDPARARIKQPSTIGYASTRWPIGGSS